MLSQLCPTTLISSYHPQPHIITTLPYSPRKSLSSCASLAPSHHICRFVRKSHMGNYTSRRKAHARPADTDRQIKKDLMGLEGNIRLFYYPFLAACLICSFCSEQVILIINVFIAMEPAFHDSAIENRWMWTALALGHGVFVAMLASHFDYLLTRPSPLLQNLSPPVLEVQ